MSDLGDMVAHGIITRVIPAIIIAALVVGGLCFGIGYFVAFMFFG